MIIHWEQVLFVSYCLISIVLSAYYLYFFLPLSYYRPIAKKVSQTHPVTVIICARDEAANLVKNLPGSLVQKYPTTHEVIVVDDNSFDEGRFIVEEFQKTFKQLHLIQLKQEARFIPGKKFPLSVGIKTAKYELLLLTDADCVPASEHWIKKMVEGYDENTEIVLGYGAHNKRKGSLNKLIRWETFHTALQYLSYALAGNPYMGVGRNLSYKRSVFFRHKGFSSHNHIASGDDDLFINIAANKKNTAIVIDKDSFTLSDPPVSMKSWMKQKRRHYTTGRYYKPNHKILLGMYSLCHFLYYPLLVVCAFWYGWKTVLVIYFIRLILQGFILYKMMKKLDEKDLFPWFWLLDIWMFFYYLVFSVAMLKKPAKSWK